MKATNFGVGIILIIIGIGVGIEGLVAACADVSFLSSISRFPTCEETNGFGFLALVLLIGGAVVIALGLRAVRIYVDIALAFTSFILIWLAALLLWYQTPQEWFSTAPLCCPMPTGSILTLPAFMILAASSFAPIVSLGWGRLGGLPIFGGVVAISVSTVSVFFFPADVTYPSWTLVFALFATWLGGALSILIGSRRIVAWKESRPWPQGTSSAD